jgi:hypothetical protein
MVCIYPRVGKTLTLGVTVLLPLPTGKDAIISMVVASLHAIGAAELLES